MGEPARSRSGIADTNSVVADGAARTRDGVDEASRSAADLAALSAELRDLVGQFRVWRGAPPVTSRLRTPLPVIEAAVSGS